MVEIPSDLEKKLESGTRVELERLSLESPISYFVHATTIVQSPHLHSPMQYQDKNDHYLHTGNSTVQEFLALLSYPNIFYATLSRKLDTTPKKA